MSKQVYERFPITVQTEKKTYAPGEPVPVGKDDGVSISQDEVNRLRENFGVWIGGPDVNGGLPVGADVSELQAQIDVITQERDDLLADKDRLTAENGRLSGELDKRPKSAKADLEKLTAENARLSGEHAELSAAKAQLEADNATLAGHVDKLTADIAELTAPKD